MYELIYHDKYSGYLFTVKPNDQNERFSRISVSVTTRSILDPIGPGDSGHLIPASLNWSAYGAKEVEFAQVFAEVIREAVELAKRLDDGWRPSEELFKEC